MKKKLPILFIIFLGVVASIYYWNFKVSRENIVKDKTDTLVEKAQLIISALAKKDSILLSKQVHPQKGIFFSSYVYLHPGQDLIFSAKQVQNIFEDKNIYTWGVFDGSGKPIKMTFGEYYQKFIYDGNFIESKNVSFNQIVQRGNSKNNIKESYATSEFVEYYLPPLTETGLDWKSLWLIFEKYGNDWFLIGIAHDQWTI